jgi:hypothetical protein
VYYSKSSFNAVFTFLKITTKSKTKENRAFLPTRIKKFERLVYEVPPGSQQKVLIQDVTMLIKFFITVNCQHHKEITLLRKRQKGLPVLRHSLQHKKISAIPKH